MNFVNDKRFVDLPMVLETPKGEEGYSDDIKAIESVME
jgi:endonuclease IV